MSAWYPVTTHLLAPRTDCLERYWIPLFPLLPTRTNSASSTKSEKGCLQTRKVFPPSSLSILPEM